MTNIFNSDENVYQKIDLLTRLPNASFIALSATNKLYYTLCNKSRYSEGIYEMRVRNFVLDEIIEFKPSKMTWKEFYQRTYIFTIKLLYYTFQRFKYANKLAKENKLMELKILESCYGVLPSVAGANKAIETLNIEVLLWLKERDIIPYYECTIWSLDKAIKLNRIDMMKWICFEYPRTPQIKLKSIHVKSIIEKDNLKMLKTFSDCIDKSITNNNILNDLASKGEWKKLDYIFYYIGILPNEKAAYYAAKNDQIDTVKWLYKRGIVPDEDGIDFLVKCGKKEALQFLSGKNNVKFNEINANSALEYGQFDILKWLYEKDIYPNEVSAADKACITGNLKLIEWIISKRIILPSICGVDYAIEYGHLKIVQILHERKIISPNTISAYIAAQNGRLEILQWMDSIGIKMNKEVANLANNHNMYSVVKWLDEEKGIKYNPKADKKHYSCQNYQNISCKEKVERLIIGKDEMRKHKKDICLSNKSKLSQTVDKIVSFLNIK